MNRSLFIWAPFAMCVGLVLTAMLWVTSVALQLDAEQIAARRQATLEENTRLALWRMDYAVGPLVAEIAQQPYFAYASFYPLSRAYEHMFNVADRGETMLPSPLLNPTSRSVRLYFQVDAAGVFSSPQAPATGLRALAIPRFIDDETFSAATNRLQELARRVTLADFMRRIPDLADDPVPTVTMGGGPRPQLARAAPNAPENVQPAQPPQPQRGANIAQGAELQQQKRSIGEAEARERSYQTLTESNSDNRYQQFQQYGDDSRSDVVEGPMTPLWLDSHLFVVRRVRVGNAAYIQGACMDWDALSTLLTGAISDLLPGATLEPLPQEPIPERERRLAALPIRLIPGALPDGEAAEWSPIRVALVVAWICVTLATGAIGLLLFGADSLGRRRSAFASAVTHELRTPLTTFRLYSEMLARGAITDERRRQEYFETLQAEAERLGHLVENVLTYARLERGRAAGPTESIRMSDFIDRVRDRLTDHAARAGMELRVSISAPATRAVLLVSSSAVEQILMNLIDNACKYARSPADSPPRPIELSAELSPTSGAPRQALIRVRDFGPGIEHNAARRIFRVFHKSARDAAATAPGVGLGLALSRRLARGLGGELRLQRGVTPGASFVLELPLARSE